MKVLRVIARALWLIALTTLSFAYTLVTRLSLYVLTLYLALYFFLNTEFARLQIMRLLTDALPGSFNCTTLEVLPSLSEVAITDAIIEDDLGRAVIQTRIAETGYDLAEFLRYGLRALTGEPGLLRIVLLHPHATDADVLVEVDPDGWAGIGTAASVPARSLRSGGRASRSSLPGRASGRGRPARR